MAENKSITSDCYEERCFVHDQGIFECARNGGFATVYELLGTATKTAKRSTHKWREFYRDTRHAVIVTDHAVGDNTFALDKDLGFSIGDELHVEGQSAAYPVTGVSADGLTITVGAPVGDDVEVLVGGKVTGIDAEGECICEADVCKADEPEEKENHVQIFRSCAISASKMAEINAKNGAYLDDKSILQANLDQEVYDMLKKIDRAIHYSIKSMTGDKRKMGGLLSFLTAPEVKDDVCIDASEDFLDWDGNVKVPSLTEIVNKANADLLACGGTGANVVMAHPETIQGFSTQGACLDNCNKDFNETTVGNAPALQFRANLAGVNGTNRMQLLPNQQIPKGEMWIGNINSVQLLSLEGCPLRLKQLNSLDPECPVYVLQAELTLEVTNVKCNWRRVKEIVIC